jgi:DNA-directed RNA polymerase specialized sigma24 family protein
VNQDEAIAWVDRFRPLLEKRSRRIITALPYDPEDYIHDSYEAALISERISTGKGLSFSSVFWNVFRQWKRRVTQSIDINECEEFQDEIHYVSGSSIPDPEEALLRRESSQDLRDMILMEFMECLTFNERSVLACVAGLSREKMSYRDTAVFLGITHGAVSQIVGRLMKKAEKFRNRSGSTEGVPVHSTFDRKEALDGSERGEFIVRNTVVGSQENGKGRSFAVSPG